MISLETTRSKLFDLLTGKNFDITTRDAQGKETTDPKTADLYSFEYKADGKTYGNVVITVGAKGEMEVFYGDMLGKGMDAEHKGDWYDFLYQLRHFAKRNMLEFTLKNINRLKYSMQSMASLEESKNYYGFKKTSYTKPNKQAKLKIIHSKPIDEEAGDQRYRNIQSLYVKTQTVKDLNCHSHNYMVVEPWHVMCQKVAIHMMHLVSILQNYVQTSEH